MNKQIYGVEETQPEQDGFVFIENGHKYYLDGHPMTGVTTVLGVLAKPALIQWAADMAIGYIEEKSGPPQMISGYPFFSVSPIILAEARLAHRKKKEAAGVKGTDLHAQVEILINEWIKQDDGHPSNLIGIASEGLKAFADWAVKNNVRFLASEKKVYSKEWFVAGTFDFSFEKDGKRYIGDLKTMKKLWDRVPHFQCAAYMKMSVEMGEKPYDGTCIVNINKDTNELTDSWTYDHANDKKAFESALFLYRQLNNY